MPDGTECELKELLKRVPGFEWTGPILPPEE
jgi:hypothetical protein